MGELVSRCDFEEAETASEFVSEESFREKLKGLEDALSTPVTTEAYRQLVKEHHFNDSNLSRPILKYLHHIGLPIGNTKRLKVTRVHEGLLFTHPKEFKINDLESIEPNLLFRTDTKKVTIEALVHQQNLLGIVAGQVLMFAYEGNTETNGRKYTEFSINDDVGGLKMEFPASYIQRRGDLIVMTPARYLRKISRMIQKIGREIEEDVQSDPLTTYRVCLEKNVPGKHHKSYVEMMRYLARKVNFLHREKPLNNESPDKIA